MSGCCNESGCRRSQPILIRQGGLSGQWYAVTRYKVKPHPSGDPDQVLIEAIEKHRIDPPVVPEQGDT